MISIHSPHKSCPLAAILLFQIEGVGMGWGKGVTVWEVGGRVKKNIPIKGVE